LIQDADLNIFYTHMPIETTPTQIGRGSGRSVGEKQNLYNASEMKKVIQTAEMALWLDGYDDMFSDFDPRPYSERSLSDDFLVEMKKAAFGRGKDSDELKFLLAPEVRDHKLEEVIKERLKAYFSAKHHRLIQEKKKIIRQGVTFVGASIVLMFIATLIFTFVANKTFLINFLVILLEPAGWFLFWEGLARTIYKAEETNSEINFFHKMAHCKISFISY
jgi:hypothetical protein